MKKFSINHNYQSIYSRNWGLISESEQDALRRTSIGIAGVGGIGGLLAERLLRLGVGHLKITDPGSFEVSNLNRQFGSSTANLGKNKAEVVYNQTKDINPDAVIDWDDRGICTVEDASSFVSNCALVIDEMDAGMYRESIILQRAAREKGIYYSFTVAMGFGALLAIFSPDGMTLAEYNKLPIDVDVNNPESLRIPMECITPLVPSYAANFEPETVQQLIAGELPGPTTSIGVGLASIVAANEAMNIILKKRAIPVAPQYIYIDLIDFKLVIGTMG